MNQQATTAAHAHGDPKRVRNIYLAVFAALFVLTILTVAVNYLNVARPLAIAVAAAIALVKVCLIAMFFMHLKMEGKWIFGVVVLSVIAILILIFLISPDIGGVLGGMRH